MLFPWQNKEHQRQHIPKGTETRCNSYWNRENVAEGGIGTIVEHIFQNVNKCQKYALAYKRNFIQYVIYSNMIIGMPIVSLSHR